MPRIAIGLLLICLLPLLAHAEEPEKNYCEDAATWAEWDDVVTKYPNDLGLHALHALRIGLCTKVEHEQLSIGQATTIFENARETLFKRRTQGQKKRRTRPGE